MKRILSNGSGSGTPQLQASLCAQSSRCSLTPSSRTHRGDSGKRAVCVCVGWGGEGRYSGVVKFKLESFLWMASKGKMQAQKKGPLLLKTTFLANSRPHTGDRDRQFAVDLALQGPCGVGMLPQDFRKASVWDGKVAPIWSLRAEKPCSPSYCFIMRLASACCREHHGVAC